MADPRLYQICTLASLLVYGIGWLDFDVTPARVALLVATALATQAVGDRIVGNRLPFRSSARSALISGLSLCLLLRTNSAGLAATAAVAHHRQQVRHPHTRQARLQSNQRWDRRDAAAHQPGLGVARAMGSSRVLRVSDGVCGLAGRQPCCAFRRDLCVHRVLLRTAVRPLAVPRRAVGDSTAPTREWRAVTVRLFHDLRSQDDARFASWPCAVRGARGVWRWYVQFRLFRTNGLLWSLAACSMAVPLLDRIIPGSRHAWLRPQPLARPSPALRAA